MQKAQKPTLTGQRIKTRKRDEKEKYDPITFRDQIVTGLNEAELDLDKASQFLVQAGSKLDIRRYAEALFDILITGGVLAPGGTVIDENDAVNAALCVFNTEFELTAMRQLVSDLFERIIRQFKYLEKSLDDEMKKILQFLKGFNDEERQKLALSTYIMISKGLCTPVCLNKILNEYLVKEGIAPDFAKLFFKTWLAEKDFNSLLAILKKAELDGKLLELFPLNKRSLKTFEEFFGDEDLRELVEFQRNHLTRNATKDLKAKLNKKFSDDESASNEVVLLCHEYEEKFKLGPHQISEIIWSCMMKSVEWNKKEDLLADQAVKHIKAYSPILAEFANTPQAENALLIKIQEYCYDNMNFMKVFQKIVMLLYQTDVLSEDTILLWYKSEGKSKGKSVFIEQMQKMIQWLQNAEEESSDDDEDDEEEEQANGV